MQTSTSAATDTAADPTMRELIERVRRRERVRHRLSAGGLLSIDRGLPFLLVNRAPPDRPDAGTARLVLGESSFLVSRSGEEQEVSDLVRVIAREGSAAYGAFLVIEVWSAEDPRSGSITIKAPKGPAAETVGKLTESLESVAALRPGLDVRVELGEDRQPPHLPPLLTIEESWQGEILLLGIELPPVYRDPETGSAYPRFVRRLQQQLSKALRQAIHEFVRVQTTAEVVNPLALGTRTVPDDVWDVDKHLYDIERSFDLLLLTTPVNLDDAWERFKADGFDRDPRFHYRLLPVDPDLLKRRLFTIEMETIDDPALAELYQDKRQELDTQLTMIGERGSDCFRYSSMRLYGRVDERLHEIADELLRTVSPPPAWEGEWATALDFRDAAIRELEHYTSTYPELVSGIQVRRDLVGLMVSEGKLLIGAKLRLRPDRVAPLIHHEVGTHVLTYVNGAAQPLKQLSLGLADYDELQEGLAVLSEYLAGGLDRLRMRTLAARVVAAHSVERGGSFVDTFRLLTDGHGYSAVGAWHIAVRVHACGGFTRDLIYLRGLVELLNLLAKGGTIESLYIGKIAQKHIPIVDELRHRGILREPPLAPRFLEDPAARERLAAVRRGITLTEMICQETV